jgi:hypothetical protein
LPETITPDKIQLGQVITEVSFPEHGLASPSDPRPNEPEPRHTKESRTFLVSRTGRHGGSVSAHILSFITLGLFLYSKRHIVHKFEIHGTTTFTFSPDKTYMDKTTADLQNIIRKKKKVYMVVGLKVADKATIYHRWNAKKGGGVKAGGAPNAFVQLDIDGKITGSSYMDDKEEVDFPFVYAYQLRACIKDRDAYNVSTGYVRRDGNLFSLSSPSSGDKSVPSQQAATFELARSNENEQDVQYESVADFTDDDGTFRGVFLKYSPPTSLHISAVMGVALYAVLIAYWWIGNLSYAGF